MVIPTIRRAYVAGALVWTATLPLGAFAATRVHASTAVHFAAFAIYSIGSLLCHQRPERSFHLWTAQLPVCARCTGIYLAATMTALSYRASDGWRSVRRFERGASAERIGRNRLLALLAALPTIATLAYEWTTGDTPSNAVRFAAGLPLGAVVSWLVLRVN